jgi:cellulose synthase operon protein C
MGQISHTYGRNILFAVVCALLIACPVPSHAQSAAEKALLAKAKSLADTGHLNIAVQTWQQVLLADNTNKEALAGLAKADMRLGKTEEANKYLDRLRAAGGSPAEIAQIQAMQGGQPQPVQLRKAAQLAQQGQYAEAMRIYRKVFGANPPAGNEALAYYDTEAAIPADRQHAIEGLRRLAKQFPANSRYAITLGRVLTYDPGTRAEGVSILRSYQEVPEAQEALRQAESWNARSMVERSSPAEEAKASEQAAETSPEARAYRELNSGHIDAARREFQSLLNKQPRNAAALSGMGYVSMKQQDFSSAVSYFERARAAGVRNLDTPLNTSRFWLTMKQAGDELSSGNASSAAQTYRSALALKPGSADAFEGLGNALASSGENTQAANAFEQALLADPHRAGSWQGLFLAYSASGDAQAALNINDRMPQNVHAQLTTNPDYLRSLIHDDRAVGRKDDADRTISEALALPFPDGGRNLPVQTQMQYASLLMAAGKYPAAVYLYERIVAQNPDDAGAWRAIIAVQHQMNQDDQALATLGSMPQTVFEKEQNDAAFLVLIGSIFQSQHELRRAQKYLERALSITSSGQSGIELQLASIYAAQGDAQRAYAIYARELSNNPESEQAWLGELSALHQMNRDRDALHQTTFMPESVRVRLEENPDYLQVLASIQVSVGQTRAALGTFSRLSEIYAARNIAEPVDVQIQYGWALLKSGDTRRLYVLISSLSTLTSMTDTQQRDFNHLWASWSIQQAQASLAAGDSRRALAILGAAAQTFPEDTDVDIALAGAYMSVGHPKQALSIYTALNMSQASLPQIQGAIGAALAGRDMSHAEQWLEIALDRYKDNPTILKMAAQYEQARGNNERAAAYYRAALNALGPAPIGGDLLSQPGEPAYRASPGQQLMQLLAPGRSAALMNNLGPGAVSPGTNSSQQNALGGGIPTLGDYAQSSQGSSDAGWTAPASKRSSTLADYAATDDLPPIKQNILPTKAQTDLQADHTHTDWQNTPPDNSTQISNSARPQSSSTPKTDRSLNAFSAPAPTDSARPEERPEFENTSRNNGSASDLNPAGSLQAAVSKMDRQSDASSTGQPQSNSQPIPVETLQNDQTQIAPITTRPVESAALPPLTGPALPVEHPKSDREQVEQQLAVLEGASSDWVGGSSDVNYRSGQPGYDRLAIFSMPIEASGTLGSNVRTTVIADPVLLDAGQATSTATFRQGTLAVGAVPYVQTASGIGGEFQLRAPSFAVRLGYTPHGFLVENVTGGIYVHPPSSHFTLTFGRDPIYDTQLSYAGLRDLGSRSSTYIGNVWGGVIANAGELQLAFGDERSGWYIQGGGQYITGRHVEDNRRVDGDAGAYWAAWRNAQYGRLTLGVNFFGMHYDHNLRYFTYGQGGYFSPGAYMLAGIPFTFNGYDGPRFHYSVNGSVGAQAFEEDSARYFPLDPSIQAANNNPYYPEQTSVGGNYSFKGEGSYAIADHWYVGGYLNFNNSRDYANEQTGFFVRYLFRPQPMTTENGPTGLFPVHGLRPLQVP